MVEQAVREYLGQFPGYPDPSHGDQRVSQAWGKQYRDL